MKIYIDKYRSHWLSPYVILTKICFWENEDTIYNLKDDPKNPYIKLVKLLEPICKGFQWFLDIIHPRIQYIKIDPWDTWSMDATLADIILPMLKQLRDTKHGAPFVDDEDVPEELKSTSAPTKENDWDTDDNHFKRWDWVLDEMIWAFEQKVDGDSEDQFFDHSESNGKTPWDKDYVGPKYDREGYEKWQERKSNGFRLFGRYYENLWD